MYFSLKLIFVPNLSHFEAIILFGDTKITCKRSNAGSWSNINLPVTVIKLHTGQHISKRRQLFQENLNGNQSFHQWLCSAINQKYKSNGLTSLQLINMHQFSCCCFCHCPLVVFYLVAYLSFYHEKVIKTL